MVYIYLFWGIFISQRVESDAWILYKCCLPANSKCLQNSCLYIYIYIYDKYKLSMLIPYNKLSVCTCISSAPVLCTIIFCVSKQFLFLNLVIT